MSGIYYKLSEIYYYYKFDIEKTTEELISWISDWFKKNGNGCNAIVGISGGKDSSVVAALCAKALGANRVYGVLMPNGEQSDIDIAKDLVRHLGIRCIETNIEKSVDAVLDSIISAFYDNVKDGLSAFPISEQARINLPARIRMVTLYAISQNFNGRVANTCNLSEDWVGYATRYGDAAGDFSPLSQLTTDEVIAIGEYLDLPTKFTRKTPIDGLCGKTDEENLGFSYAVLNKYLRTGICEDADIKNKIDSMHKKNIFKLQPMPCYVPTGLNVVI